MATRRKLIVFDTTLREGEQAPGCMMLVPEKVEVALSLERVKVDVIEAGFAAASPGDFQAVREVSRVITQAVVSSLTRAIPNDIDASLEALKDARQGRVHIFLGVSDLHLQHKLRMTRQQALGCIEKCVRYARRFSGDVQFTAEDAGRADENFLIRVVDRAVDSGADTVNLSDTVGWLLPDEFGALIRRVRENARALARARLSVHVHDDLGLALASTIAAVNAGVEQIECTVNGIGDRAGICALEELAHVLSVRQDFFPEVRTDIQRELLPDLSRLVARVSGARLAPNKAVVGVGVLNGKKSYNK